MERNMHLVIFILKELNKSPGSHGGYSYIFTQQRVHDHEREVQSQHSVLLPLALCSDENTFRYHAQIMDQSGLIEYVIGEYGDCPAWRLTWHGQDFLASVEQEGVLEKVEATHGPGWKSLPFDVLKALIVEVGKQLVLKPYL